MFAGVSRSLAGLAALRHTVAEARRRSYPADVLVLGGATGRRRPGWIVRGCTREAACPVTVVPLSGLARTASQDALVRNLLREAVR